MFGPRIQEWARRFAEQLISPLRGSVISPNLLTLFGLLLSVITASVIAQDHLLVGGLLVLVAGAFDMLDGALARVKGMASVFGAFFDSCLDRLSEALILLGVLVYFLRQGSFVGVVLVYMTAVGSLMISYNRARAEGLGLQCRVGLLARPERVLVLAAGLILFKWLLLPALAVLALMTNVTAVQRILHVWRTAPPPAPGPEKPPRVKPASPAREPGRV